MDCNADTLSGIGAVFHVTVEEVSTEPAQTPEMVYSIEVVKGAAHDPRHRSSPLHS